MHFPETVRAVLKLMTPGGRDFGVYESMGTLTMCHMSHISSVADDIVLEIDG